jgi:phosphate transport system substrate-binding protein
VSSLSKAQVRDIHTGKIKNWKEVGGKDMPITVFTDTVTGGTRALIKQEVMGGEEYAKSAVALASVKKVGDMVAAETGGFGGMGKGFVEAGKVKVIQTDKLERPLGFITMGAPSDKVKKIIEAYKAEIKKAKK